VLALVRQLVLWIAEHQHVAGVIVFSIACAEALAFVGLVVPGATLMIGASAVVGDGVSYWIGGRYRNGLRAMRLLRETAIAMNRCRRGLSSVRAASAGAQRCSDAASDATSRMRKGA